MHPLWKNACRKWLAWISGHRSVPTPLLPDQKRPCVLGAWLAVSLGACQEVRHQLDYYSEMERMTKAEIHIKGPFATLVNYPIEKVADALTAEDPSARHSRAFKEGRWDGKVELYNGQTFLAGLSSRVQRAIRENKDEAVIIDPDRPAPLDLSKFTRDIIPGITLWDHQYEGCLAMLTHPRCCIKAATSSGKTGMMFAVAKFLYQEQGIWTLVIVPKRGLVRQTVRRFREYAAGTNIICGQMGDSIKSIGQITVGTPQTLAQFKSSYAGGKFRAGNVLIQKLLRKVGALLLDETHRASCKTWEDIAASCVNAKYRIGGSGTPIKHKLANDLQMIGLCGPLVFSASADVLINAGLAAKPKIAIVMSENASGMNLPPMDYADAYTQGIVLNDAHNKMVIDCVEWMVLRRRRTLLLCRRLDHYAVLKKLLAERTMRFAAIEGATLTDVRDRVKSLFSARRIDVIAATDIFSEGEDLPSIEAIVLAEGVKANTSAVQRIGRGMRLEKGGPADVWVVDTIPTCSKMLMRHGLARCEFYEKEGYDVRLVTHWPKDTDLKFDHNKLLPFLDWDKEIVTV